MLIRRSILSPRDSTWSQLSNSVLSVQVYSNSASIKFFHRPHFCCTDIALFFECFRLHVSPFFYWNGNALVIFRLNILRRQRRIIQQLLYKVHISIKIQVTRDIRNTELIVQWPSITWYTLSLRVWGTFSYSKSGASRILTPDWNA